MVLRTLIVDDELPARQRLKRLLADIEGVELIGEAESGTQAVEMIERERPDLVLLDIQMPGLDGFGVIEMLESPPLIIFVTAYDEYAIRAFEVNALDYLLKPFSRKRLERAIERARRELERRTDFSTKLDALLDTLEKQKRYLERIAFREGDKIRVVDVAEIDWIGAERGRVFIHVGERRHAVRYTLEELERRLDPCLFFRCHRSLIVNLTKIKEIIPWFAGTYRIKLVTSEELDLARNRVKELKKLIKW